MGLDFDVWRGMAEFALDVQCLILDGWRFDIEYGESKFDVHDAMVFKRGDETVKVRCHDDIIDLIKKNQVNDSRS